MKDLHSHLLFGIDDGSKSLKESIEILKKASRAGVTEMLVTPHYIEDSKYNCNNKDKEVLFEKLVKEAKKENINIRLYLGNEIYLSENILELLEKNAIMPLNRSKYLLIEFPMSNMYRNTSELLFSFINKGYIPIIAHPERYAIFQDHPDYLEKYLNMGVLFQGNYMSLYGKYGRGAKKTLKKLLKNDYISFLASDIHHEDDEFMLDKIKKHVKRYVKSDKKVDDLLENNFDIVVKNKDFGIKR